MTIKQKELNKKIKQEFDDAINVQDALKVILKYKKHFCVNLDSVQDPFSLISEEKYIEIYDKSGYKTGVDFSYFRMKENYYNNAFIYKLFAAIGIKSYHDL